MRRLLLGVLAAAALVALPLQAQECRPRRTALVLSGGGAKGIAHVGLLRALDSLGIRPDVVVGTSMGSIAGALYAAGLSGAEIDSVIRSAPGGTLIRSFRPIAPHALGMVPPMVSFVEGDAVEGLQTQAIRESEVNALLVRLLLLGNLRARGDFDSLPIPFRAVATDFRAKTPVVVGTGDLALAVRASIAIPIVFAPVEMGGRTLVDGGLAANIPIGIARSLGAERVIVSDVSAPVPDSVPLTSTGTIAEKLMDYVFTQLEDSLGPEDVYVKHPVDGYGALDFAPGPVAELLALGRATADSVLALPHCLATLQGDRPRRFRPVPRFVGTVSGAAGGAEAARLVEALGFSPGDSIPWAEVRERVERLAESERIDGLWLFPGGQGDTVSFTPRVTSAPRFYVGGGFAFDNTLGGRLWLGALSENALRLGLELTSVLRLGGLRDELEVAARKNFNFRFRPLAPMLQLTAANEKILQYDDAGERLPDLGTRELVGFAGVERVFGRGYRARLGAEGRVWEVEDSSGSAGGVIAQLQRFEEWDRVRGVLEFRLTSAYTRLLLEARVPIAFSDRAGVRTHLRAGYGTDLPLQLTFPLGGDDGFPGVRPTQLRGDRELSLQGQFWARVVGSTEAVVDLGVGRLASGGSFLESEGWLAGVRLGARVDTPLGPLTAGYGWATGGRDAWYLRLFRWF